jgi:hypothetical protein
MSDADMDYYIDKIDYTGWNIYKWNHTLAATIRRNRIDLYEHMLGKVTEHNPEMLASLARWLEHTDYSKLIIN